MNVALADFEPVSDADRVLMQARSHIRVLPERLLSKLPPDALKLVVNEKDFEAVCKLASVSHHAAAREMTKLAAPAGASAMLEFASLCLDGPVGVVGTRRTLRATAILLLDKVLAEQPDCARALCLKGEALLSPEHLGKAGLETPMILHKEAFALFCKAADTGCVKAKFLKGRWLVTMAAIHNSDVKTAEGKKLIKECGEAGVGSALLFLSQCYEFPGRFSPMWFSKDIPKSRKDRQRIILDLTMRAAELGDADALNDVGSSYATAYGGLQYDFEAAERYYLRAIRAGSLHAFHNLAIQYETGMDNKFPDRIDTAKALQYYQRGASLRCAKCCISLASAYTEGLENVLECDAVKAEEYYHHTIYLADDENDEEMAMRALKELVALHVTCIKANEPSSKSVQTTYEKLKRLLPVEMISATMADVNKSIVAAMRGREKQLTDLLGEHNGTLLSTHARNVLDIVQNMDGEPTENEISLVEHVFGSSSPEILRLGSRASSMKRRRRAS